MNLLVVRLVVIHSHWSLGRDVGGMQETGLDSLARIN